MRLNISLVLHLTKYYGKNIYKRAKSELANSKILDQTISNCYREQRHWISYKVPKWLDVVNSLQKEICKINNISNVGDYSYASSQLENEGVDGNFSILLDMGVPASAIKK